MPDDARVREMARRSRSCLRKAGELMDPPLEYFEVPFEGTVLPGDFRKADNSGAPRSRGRFASGAAARSAPLNSDVGSLSSQTLEWSRHALERYPEFPPCAASS
jgi:hypothetical protein